MRVAGLAVLLALSYPILADAQQPAPARQVVGVAFGRGIPRGFAHVRLVRWFETPSLPIHLPAAPYPVTSAGPPMDPSEPWQPNALAVIGWVGVMAALAGGAVALGGGS